MKKVLYTSGDDLPYWDLVVDRFKAYAARCGAELVVLPKRQGDNPQWVLFDCMAHSLTYGSEDVSALWVDADIVITSYARDLFGYGRLMVCEPGTPQRVHPKWARAVRNPKWKVPNMRPYPITGVVAWRPRHVRQLVPWFLSGASTRRFPGKGQRTNNWWGDQEVLALGLFELELPFFFFPTVVHSMGARIDRCEFGHAAGGTSSPMRKKVPQIKRIIHKVEQWEK